MAAPSYFFSTIASLFHTQISVEIISEFARFRLAITRDARAVVNIVIERNHEKNSDDGLRVRRAFAGDARPPTSLFLCGIDFAFRQHRCERACTDAVVLPLSA